MAQTKSWNPIAFRPAQVTIISSLLYALLLAALLWVHLSVPAAPTTPSPVKGINLTEAWIDLQAITAKHRPVGSEYNDEVRDYLLGRVEEILQRNQADYKVVINVNNSFVSEAFKPSFVTVFANDTSNFTSRDDYRERPLTGYSESDNLLVYIRGRDDARTDWWNTTVPYEGSSGVLVSAHYDSASTSYGATDDGVGVVSILQLISYFSNEGHAPRRGIVALLNNGEEMGLFGARNYVRHPVSQLPHTFLNLEGGGAGGRATLLRSTDAEVTKAYLKTPYPFGSIISGDAFGRGFVRSGTDYTPFTGLLGMRGLDVTFYAPRSRYHTAEDDVRDTSRNSVWHMLSAALAVSKELSSYAGDEFEGPTDHSGKFDLRRGSDAVWFDVFGRAFALMQLNALFGISVALLTVGPIFLIVLEIVLRRSGKWYLFSRKERLQSIDDESAVSLHGFRGFFRLPIAFVLATGITTGLALLIVKVNPFILYSSEYAVWGMLLCAWFTSAWTVLAGAAIIRPTALQRMYVLLWLYVGSWIALVLGTIGENNVRLGSGYLVVIYNAAVFFGFVISYMELFALPRKSKYVERFSSAQADTASVRPSSISSRRLLHRNEDDDRDGTHDGDATETTSLLRGRGRSVQTHHTFTSFSRRRHTNGDEVTADANDQLLDRAFPNEQAWSSSLPQWTWIIQFLLVVPINVILIGQIALLFSSSLHQTPADGNEVLPIYLLWVTLAVVLLLPLAPFLHRFTYHVPLVLFVALIGCLVYVLTAFPFSRHARLKVFFLQEMNLDTGANNVSLSGIDGYLQSIVAEIPSTIGQAVQCNDATGQTYGGLRSCHFLGIAPQVVPRDHPGMLGTSVSKSPYKSWLTYNVTHTTKSASFTLQGLKTKLCRIELENRVADVRIEDAALDPRMDIVGHAGTSQIHLNSRSWDKTYRVNVTWKDMPAKGQKGRVVCLWSDVNEFGVIPAFDEVLKFQPVWSNVIGTPGHNGLVEGYKDFTI